MALLTQVRTVTTGVVGAPFYTNFFFADSTGSPATAHAATVSFWSDAKSAIIGSLKMTVEGEMRLVESTTGDIVGFDNVTPVDVQGTASGDPLPFQVQGYVRARTSLAVGGRRLRGGVFMPGPAEGDSNGGVPSAIYLEVIRNAANKLATNANADWHIYSRVNKVSSSVSSVAALPRWATLRSRLT